MIEKKKTTTKYVNITISAILGLLLLFMYAFSHKSISHLIAIIVLTLLIAVFTKTFSVESFFRSIAAEIALLPYISFHIILSKNVFGFDGVRNFYQICILYSNVLRIYIPLLIVILLIISMQKENEFSAKKLKKYIPFAIIMLALFIVGLAMNSLADICLFVFTFIAIAIIKDIAERYIYKNNESILMNLPFYFLVLTAIYTMRF